MNKFEHYEGNWPGQGPCACDRCATLLAPRVALAVAAGGCVLWVQVGVFRSYWLWGVVMSAAHVVEVNPPSLVKSKPKPKRRGISLAAEPAARASLFAPGDAVVQDSAALAAPIDAACKAVQIEGQSPTFPVLMDIAIADLRIDLGVHQRDGGLVSAVVDDYRDDIQSWIASAPLVVFLDQPSFDEKRASLLTLLDRYWLADGFHRCAAAQRAGLTSVPCLVHLGKRRDAILYAVGANASHGARRTNADKRKAVKTLLDDSEWSSWSDRVIADKTLVSHEFVRSLRDSAFVHKSGKVSTVDTFHETGTLSTVDTSQRNVSVLRTGADGKTYPSRVRSAVSVATTIPHVAPVPPSPPPRSLYFPEVVFATLSDLDDASMQLRTALTHDDFAAVDLGLSDLQRLLDQVVDAVATVPRGSL